MSEAGRRPCGTAAGWRLKARCGKLAAGGACRRKEGRKMTLHCDRSAGGYKRAAGQILQEKIVLELKLGELLLQAEEDLTAEEIAGIENDLRLLCSTGELSGAKDAAAAVRRLRTGAGHAQQ
jgi:hypothetical protein